MESVISARRIRILHIVIFVAILEALPRLGYVDRLTLIPVSEMILGVYSFLISGAWNTHIQATFLAATIAFMGSVIVGVPIGILLWFYETMGEVLDPYLLAGYAFPFFAFYPLLIVLFGLNILPIILIAFSLSVVVVIQNVRTGLADIPQIYYNVGKSLNLTKFEMLRHVYLRPSLIHVFAGLKLGFIYALLGTIASEFILSNKGLGFLISSSYNQFQTLQMFSAMIFVITIALIMNLALLKIEKRVEVWRE